MLPVLLLGSTTGLLLPTHVGTHKSIGEKELVSRFGLPQFEEPLAMDRRSAVSLGMAGAAVSLFGGAMPASASDGMFAVPPLPYAYDALEPTIDAATMKFHVRAIIPFRPPPSHYADTLCGSLDVDACVLRGVQHDFHHQAYVNNLNKAMAGKPAASVASLMKGAKAAKLNNAGGGHYNHCLFWQIMGPKAGGEPSGALAEKITAAFGSFDEFKAQFSAAAAGVFGSGWAWLAVGKDGAVKILTTPNQDNPLMDSNGDIPIMGIDGNPHLRARPDP
jgi:Fe-Mn family superoxide dismutase